MNILFLSWWWPYPANNGAKLRIYNLLRQLSAHHSITLLSFAEAEEATTEQIEHLRIFCAHVEAVAKPRYNPGTVRATLGYLSPWPRSLVDVYSPVMAKKVEEVARRAPPDVMIASQFQTMRYLDVLPGVPAVLEEIEITGFHNRVQAAGGTASRFRAQMTLTKFENALQALLKRGVALTVVSPEEQAYIRRFAPADARIAVIPNGVDVKLHTPDPTVELKPFSLIYTGSVTYSANYDAVSFFIKDVLPLVRARQPAAQFTVTGGTGDIDVSDLASQPGVTFTGHLSSIARAVQEHQMLVVPLREGGGTRLKILEAMALGTPVVATHKGAEGLAIRNGEHALLEDTPEAFADAILRLFEDAALRSRLSTAGRALVESQYDWAIIGRHLMQVIHAVTPSQNTIKEHNPS